MIGRNRAGPALPQNIRASAGQIAVGVVIAREAESIAGMSESIDLAGR